MKKMMMIVGAVVCALTAVAEPALRADRSEWISIKEMPTETGFSTNWFAVAVPGTSWFARPFTNKSEIVSAKWAVSGLGVFDVYVNGTRVGKDFLKPGFTNNGRTKYVYSYDVTNLLKTKKGESNVLAAEVSSGWWRDRMYIVHCQCRQKSAFRGELEIVYADGQREVIGSKAKDWLSGITGPVVTAGIFEGETFDARVARPTDGKGLTCTTEVNKEFGGRTLLTDGAEITLRHDLAMVRGPYKLKKGDTLVVDFDQNCAGVPEFRFKAKRGTVLTALPGEMLNDADKGVRGCDGPKGSVYRANLRIPNVGMRIVYTFAGEGLETYLPRFTFFGYRYLSITATDDVEIERVTSIPVTSITKEMEIGSLEVGDKTLDRFIKNAYWGMLSNFLSVPTDCPQRDERYGWTGDAQLFSETACFNANVVKFYNKFMRDLCDTQSSNGGFTAATPFSFNPFYFGWGDAGVIIPWTVWNQFGDTEIVRDNWAAMMKFVRTLDETKYDFEGKHTDMIWADWLSLEKYGTAGNKYGNWATWKKHPDAMNYRRFLAACYWLYDVRLMAQMGEAVGKTDDVAWLRASEKRALEYIRGRFLESDGLLLKPMRDLQTGCVFALYFGIVEGAARQATKEILFSSIRKEGNCLLTGIHGTRYVMDMLIQENEKELAYNLLFRREFPSWLYSVDQGATTIWERWNSYTKKDGFGPVGMNSFNHYMFGAVVGWVYRTAAGISAAEPGFKKVRLAPQPDRRLGFVRASYKTPAGVVKSSWKYEGDTWVWDFTIPEGATGCVTVPGKKPACYKPGTYQIKEKLAP